MRDLLITGENTDFRELSAMSLPFCHLVVFVATRAEDVPPGCERYLSVDGSIPGAAVTWDHHVTGERINLEAMPDEFDAGAYQGVGTTLADADALASVVAVLSGGKSRVPLGPRAILESASFWCDHLRGHPEHEAETNRLGRGLLDAIDARLGSLRRAEATRVFAELGRELATLAQVGAPFPFDDRYGEAVLCARAAVAEGRLSAHGGVALVDLRGFGRIDPAALYAEHSCPVAVHVERHDDGGPRYTVGTHPGLLSAPDDLRPALARLARAEFVHGPPALLPAPGPGSENWGGRARVFGSPWNYGSRLRPEEVVEIVRAALGL